MATKQRKRTTGNNKSQTRSSGSSKGTIAKRTTKKRTNQTKVEHNPYIDEILLVMILMISVLFILSNFNLAGPVGKYINHFLFGMIGVLAYVIPYLLFVGVAFFLSNRNNPLVKRKLGYMAGLFVVLSGLMQMFQEGRVQQKNLFGYYQYSAKSFRGGGLIGGSMSKFLINFFGEIGTYVILMGFVIILFILITEKLVFTKLTHKGHQAVTNMRERNQAYQEEQNSMEDVAPPKREKRNAKTFTFPKNAKEKEEKEMTAEEIFGTPLDNNPIFQEELNQKFNTELNPEEEVVIKEEEEFPIVKEPEKKRKKEVSLEPKKGKKNKEEKDGEVVPVIKEVQDNGGTYSFPSTNLLTRGKSNTKGTSDRELKETAKKLQTTLASFGVRVTIINVSCGPAVTRYELQPEQGVKVSKITNLADDIKLNLAAADVRIEAPIPGKAAVGIEVPNKENSMVIFRDLIESNEFKNHPSNISFAVGKDIAGHTVVTDIGKMPHLLIAGATGSGKSVCINTLIMSILYKANPQDVKLIMVDPKVVELSIYNGIPHLLIPVVTDPKKASAALNWAVMEMTDRYNRFADLGVRDIKGYNDKVSQVEEDQDPKYQKMPQIVIIVDELADLMMVAPGEVEDAICRLAQMARAAGLHLIIATQRPSVNVITGLIKANVPSRIAFSVSSAIDSRTILDGSGAEKLLGKGDMLFFPSGYPKPVRIQGAFVSDKEVSAVVEFLSSQNHKPQYQEEIAEKINAAQTLESGTSGGGSDRDDYFVEAGKFIIEKDKASIGMLQRVYKIGFNRAARIMDQLSEAGVVGPEEGTKPRKVLMSMEEFEQYIDEYV